MKLESMMGQSHRWLSIVFTATVAANFAARGFGKTCISG